MDNDYSKKMSIAILAIMAALVLLGVVIMLAVMTIPVQEAEAGYERGAAPSTAVNALKGRCFHL
jgi:hypothetical protein